MAVKYDYDKSVLSSVVRVGLKAPSSNWSDIKCGLCGTVSRAYWWSLSGGGKKCEGCGAIHNSALMTAPVIKKSKS